MLSKFQSQIYFEQGKWLMEDGFKGKRSLNGTWLYLNEDFQIYEGMTFKANQTLFQASILN